MLVIPPGLSEEEEALQKKFKEEKEKGTAGPEEAEQQQHSQPRRVKRSLPAQPVLDAATATEQAKRLVKSGAISAVKAETKNSGFKRARTLEGKFKDPEKGPVPTSQPLQGSLSADDHLQESPRRPQRTSLYESFVSASARLRTRGQTGRRQRARGLAMAVPEALDGAPKHVVTPAPQSPLPEAAAGTAVVSGTRTETGTGSETDRDRDRDQDRDRERDRESDSFPERRAPRKGNTLYVFGEDVTPTLLCGAFSPFGNITDLSMDPPRNCAFVTYEKMESADEAVAELNGTQVESVQLKVSIARQQPMLDAAPGKSVWGSLALQSSPQGCHWDKRTQIVYNDDVCQEHLVGGF
ncbi:Negative elongation factor E [Myotis brandtii]|uniref:Negative elongation factor E n=1 Tax=Myotis brandtii TaxID=109478 RepID=S7PR91_MYOBR|nr:Negative elongation factor E [Myotis brandtii]